jgi:hypothetical protein
MDESADPGRRNRLKRHLIDNIVGYAALFVALGGTASAAAIVTSNSQVGPNVIAGAATPSGDTDNVIAGSLGTKDLAAAAVTKGKIAANAIDSTRILNGGVATADLAPSAVTTGKLGNGQVSLSKLGSDVQVRMDWDSSQSPTPIWQLGNIEVFAVCLGSTPPSVEIGVQNNSSTDTATASIADAVSGSGGGPTSPGVQSASVPPGNSLLIGSGVGNGEDVGTIVVRLPTETVVGSFHMSAVSTCLVQGTLTHAIG